MITRVISQQNNSFKILDEKSTEITQVSLFLHFRLILNMSTTIKSFFDRQKGDLSDKSNEDNERKKASESSLNISLSKDDTDIFE